MRLLLTAALCISSWPRLPRQCRFISFRILRCPRPETASQRSRATSSRTRRRGRAERAGRARRAQRSQWSKPLPACAPGAVTRAWASRPTGGLLCNRQRQGRRRDSCSPEMVAPTTLASFDGIAQDPASRPTARPSRCSRRSARASKRARPRPASARSARSARHNDEQRIAVVPPAAARFGRSRPADATSTNMTGRRTAAASSITSAPGNGDNNWWVATLDRVDSASGTLRASRRRRCRSNLPARLAGRPHRRLHRRPDERLRLGRRRRLHRADRRRRAGRPARRAIDGTFTSLLWGRTGPDGIGAGRRPQRNRAVRRDRWRRRSRCGQRRCRIAAGDAPLRAAPPTADRRVRQPGLRARRRRSSPGARRALRQITHDNDGWRRRSRRAASPGKADRYTVQGWLLAPRTRAAGQGADGRPGARRARRGQRRRLRRGEGTHARDLDPTTAIIIFLPNPRGSYGQGEAFTRANIRDFGGGDLKDILAGIDAAEQRRADRRQSPRPDGLQLRRLHGDVGEHPDRPLQGDRGRRAASSDWISYYGTNGIDQWMIPLLRQVDVRRSGALLGGVGDPHDQERAHADLHLCRRARRRSAADPVGRISGTR